MDNRIVVLMGIFFFVFILFIGMIIFKDPLTRLTRAKEDTLPSVVDSVVFAWPLTAKADGKENVSITVFLRSNKGIPLSNKKVKLKSNIGLIKESTVVSDSGGKSTFILFSENEGTATIEAIAEDIYVLEKKVTVLFKN